MADPTTVATVHDPGTGDLYDRCWTWEAGQTYAQQNYRVMAVADDGCMSVVDAQSIYDRERELAQDCFGVDDVTLIDWD